MTQARNVAKPKRRLALWILLSVAGVLTGAIVFAAATQQISLNSPTTLPVDI